MPLGGRRNRLGSLSGPRTEGSFNGTSPALAAFLQTNTDVQVPYRFPAIPETHDDSECDDECCKAAAKQPPNMQVIAESLQLSQDAQVGYTCDYQNKRAARSCTEVRECMKGHRHLQHNIANKCPNYIGKRHTTRLMSDAYGKGICRSNQESTNLRVSGTENDVTSAESFHTASFVQFPGQDAKRWRQAIFENAGYIDMLRRIEVDWRNPQRRTPIMRNILFMYGHRPQEHLVLGYQTKI